MLFLPHFVSSDIFKLKPRDSSYTRITFVTNKIFRITFLCCSSMYDFPTLRSKPCFFNPKGLEWLNQFFETFLSFAFSLYSLKMRHRICSSGRVPNNLFGALKHRQQIYQGTIKISRKTFNNVNLRF